MLSVTGSSVRRISAVNSNSRRMGRRQEAEEEIAGFCCLLFPAQCLSPQPNRCVVLKPLEVNLAWGVKGQCRVGVPYGEFRGPTEPFVDFGVAIREGKAP